MLSNEQPQRNNHERFQERLGPLALAESTATLSVEETLEELFDIFDVYSGVGGEPAEHRDSEITAKLAASYMIDPKGRGEQIAKTAAAGLAAGAYSNIDLEGPAFQRMLDLGLVSDEDEVLLRDVFGNISDIKRNTDLTGSDKVLTVHEVILRTNLNPESPAALCLAACSAGAALNFSEFSDQARYPLEQAVHANLQQS